MSQSKMLYWSLNPDEGYKSLLVKTEAWFSLHFPHIILVTVMTLDVVDGTSLSVFSSVASNLLYCLARRVSLVFMTDGFCATFDVRDGDRGVSLLNKGLGVVQWHLGKYLGHLE